MDQSLAACRVSILASTVCWDFGVQGGTLGQSPMQYFSNTVLRFGKIVLVKSPNR